MNYKRVAYRVLVWAIFIGLVACGPRQTTISLQGEKVTEGVWNFQYKLQLDIPKQNFSQGFTGMMRLDLAEQTAQVVGLAAFGLQLFSMRVTPDAVTVEYMHPIMSRMPHAARYIGACVRAIWFEYLPRKGRLPSVRQGNVLLAATGGGATGLWPEDVRYEDGDVPFTLRARLLQAQRETPQ